MCPRSVLASQPLSVGSPDQTAEPCAGTERDLGSFDHAVGRGQEHAVLVEDGEQILRRVQRQVDRPPVKAIDPASIRWPVETRKLPSGCRPIQTPANRVIPGATATSRARPRHTTIGHFIGPILVRG